MGWKHFFSLVLLVILVAGVVFLGAQDRSAKQALTNKLWPQARVRSAIEAVEKQRRDGLLSEKSYQKRMAMLRARRAPLAMVGGMELGRRLRKLLGVSPRLCPLGKILRPY